MKTTKFPHRLYCVIKFLVLGIFLIVTIFPFYWMVITSLKQQKDIFGIPAVYFTTSITFNSYQQLFQNSNFSIYTFNSVIVSLVSSFFAIIFAVMGAYVLARFNFRSKKGVGYYFLLTQIFPTFIGLAPLYQMLATLNMIDSLPTLMVIECAYTISFSIITLRGFFTNIPKELEEAAMIDGCGRIRAMTNIIIPIIMPGIAATFIFAFVQSGNDLFSPLLFMNSDLHYTIPVALNGMINKNGIQWDVLSAGTVIAILPTIAMFAFCQKYIAGGLTAGAVKG